MSCKITFLAEVDFANILTEYSKCINTHSDIQSKSICLRPHSYNYKIQHDIDLTNSNINDAKDWICSSDIIIFAEETVNPTHKLYSTIKKFSDILGFDLFDLDVKFCIWHAGSNYRDHFNYYNNHPQRLKIDTHLYALDLYRLSPKHDNDLPLHTYQYNNFNYEEFIQNFKDKLEKKPWTILHIPSNSNKKGTAEFINAINKLNLDRSKFNFKLLTDIPNTQVIEEKKKSIFYLDQFNSAGSFGVAAVEGLLNSNFTFSVTHNISESVLKLTGRDIIPIVPIEYNLDKLDLTLKHYIADLEEDVLLQYMEEIGKLLEEWYSTDSIINYFKLNIL